MELEKAIGSAKRLMILRELTRGEKHVSELMELLRMDGKTAKHHLETLEKAGIVESRVVGRRKYYRLVVEIRLEISPPPERRYILTACRNEDRIKKL